MNTFEITTQLGCPNWCKFCPQELLIKEYKNKFPNTDTTLSLENFKIILDKIPLDTRIDVSGMSEPFLNSQCSDMILYANSKGYKIAVYTTCVNMTIKDVDKIKDLPFDVFVVHLTDGLNNTKIKVDNKLLEVIYKINESNINNLHFMTMGNTIHPLLKDFDSKTDKSLMHSRAGNVSFLEKKRLSGKIFCRYTTHSEMLPNGTVILCCMDYGIKHILGNLLYQDYNSLYESEEFKKVIKAMKDETQYDIICRSCNEAFTNAKLRRTCV